MILRADKPWLPMPVYAPDDEGAGADVLDKPDEGADDADKADAGDKDAAAAGKQDEADKTPPPDKDAADAADKAKADKDDADKQDDDKASGKDIPENWRDLAADGDEDLLKELKRYGSLKGVAKALKEAKATIRSGKMKQPMPDPSDEKAMAEWRKAEGIPDDPSGYELPEAVKKRMTDDDKPLISSFTDFAHAKGARPDVVQIATEWYFDSLEKLEGERVEADSKASETAEESLREIWGNGSYKGNLTLAQRYMEAIPGIGDKFSEFRGPDGRRLGDNPEFIEWASDMGREKFGDVVFAKEESAAAHAGRKAEIEAMMRKDGGREYWASQSIQDEYKQILEKEAKRK